MNKRRLAQAADEHKRESDKNLTGYYGADHYYRAKRIVEQLEERHRIEKECRIVEGQKKYKE